MVERHQMVGGGRVGVFRAEGPTIEEAIRTRLHYPRHRGPFWSRRTLELPFKTPPLCFEAVPKLFVSDGKKSHMAFEEETHSEKYVQTLTDYVAVAKSGGREFLLRNQEELLSGPYEIKIKSYTNDLNLIVVCEAPSRHELHLFDQHGEVVPVSSSDTGVLTSRKIEVKEANASDLSAMVIATDDNGKQSLLFIDKDSVEAPLSDMDKIRYFFDRGFGNERVVLCAASTRDQASFYILDHSGRLIHTIPLDNSPGLDLDKVGIYNFDDEKTKDITWRYPEDRGCPRAYYRNNQLLVDNCIAFNNDSSHNQEDWVAVTGTEATIHEVIRNGRIIHQTPFTLRGIECYSKGLGVVVFAKNSVSQEGRLPETVGYEILCLGPDGGSLIIEGLDASYPCIERRNGKLTCQVKMGGVKQRIEITAPSNPEEPPAAVVDEEPVADYTSDEAAYTIVAELSRPYNPSSSQ